MAKKESISTSNMFNAFTGSGLVPEAVQVKQADNSTEEPIEKKTVANMSEETERTTDTEEKKEEKKAKPKSSTKKTEGSSSKGNKETVRAKTEKPVKVTEEKTVKEKADSVHPAEEGSINMNIALPRRSLMGREKKSFQRTISLKPSQGEKVIAYADYYGITFNEFIGKMIDALPYLE